MSRSEQKVNGGTLADGTKVSDVFKYLAETLEEYGYHKAWNDGWLRDEDGAIVTCGYSYREVRVRRYLPGHKNGPAEAIIDIRRYEDPFKADNFVGPLASTWTEQRWVA
jgi:hypothetical protein